MRSRAFWALVRRQHGVVSRRQLIEIGFSEKAIEHRLATGRLRRIWPGAYAVGRPGIGQEGRWMAAVLACGPGAVLSHASAAALWGLRAERAGEVDVSVPYRRRPSLPGVAVHRRTTLGSDEVASRAGMPVTTPAVTIVDIAPRLVRGELEAAINEADRRGLITPPKMRAALALMLPRRGVGVVRRALDDRTFTLTRSQLERWFLPIAHEADLPRPETATYVNGFEVDFYWPELGLVVETDGLRYHRTPAQQARDRLRDQTHMAAGLVPLRFTHEQVRYDSDYVRTTLAAVVRRLRAKAA